MAGRRSAVVILDLPLHILQCLTLHTYGARSREEKRCVPEDLAKSRQIKGSQA